MKLAVVLFNLGGPDSLAAVEPFLTNLFSDPAIIKVPNFIRYALARIIARRRGQVARNIYAQMGGRSPIVPETEMQARALETALAARGVNAKCFIAMRYWNPLTLEAAKAVKEWAPDQVVLLPLYPQYSTTTTASSRAEWERCVKALRMDIRQNAICCYPTEEGFLEAIADGVREAIAAVKPGVSYRLLFSAHGLPKRIVDAGDPYQMHVEQTVAGVLQRLRIPDLDWSICYQSRVGPLEWIGPATDAEVKRAGADRKGLIVVPVAFVSEHSETKVELDIEYAHLAKQSGVPDYIRVPTVRDSSKFIQGLAGLTIAAVNASRSVTCAAGRICPPDRVCGHG